MCGSHQPLRPSQVCHSIPKLHLDCSVIDSTHDSFLLQLEPGAAAERAGEGGPGELGAAEEAGGGGAYVQSVRLDSRLAKKGGACEHDHVIPQWSTISTLQVPYSIGYALLNLTSG